MPEVLRYAGFANEASLNQTTPPPADFHLDIQTATLDAPANPYLIYEGGMGGRSIRTQRSGPYDPAGNVVVGCDVESAPWFLRWALGQYLFTPGVPNTHEAWGSDDVDLPSFATRIGKDTFEHVFSGCRVDSLEFKVERGFLIITPVIMAMRDSRADIQLEAALDPPVAPPIAFHEVQTWVDGIEESADCTSLTVMVNNNLSRAGGLGSRYARARANQRDVTTKMRLRFNDEGHLQRFWGASDGPDVNGGDEFPIRVLATHPDFGTLELKLPRNIFTTVPVQPSGRTEMFQDVEGRAFKDTVALLNVSEVETDILATVTNTVGSAEVGSS